MPVTYIFGHKSPDTDAICSAIANSEFKNHQGDAEYVPCRLSDINAETDYVLKRFGAEQPQMIRHVLPQVSDTSFHPAPTIKAGDTIQHAWQLMREYNFSLLPVVDEEGRLSGIVSSRDITQAYINLDGADFIQRFGVSIGTIASVIGAQILCGEPEPSHVPSGLSIWGQSEILPEYMAIVAGSAASCIRCINSPASYIIVSGAYSYEDIQQMTKAAAERGKILLYTGENLFYISRTIFQALPVQSVYKSDDIILFYPNSTIDDVREIMLETRHRYFPIIDMENRPLGLLSRRHLLTYRPKNVILVDHNERAQSVSGIDQANILEILDHHRLGDIQTGTPLFITCSPVGSTCTLVAKKFVDEDIAPTKSTAALLLSGILSDTLLFLSPTSTDLDRDMAQRMAEICGLDIHEYGNEMLRVGDDIKDIPFDMILKKDVKQYEIGKHKLYVSQVFTTDIAYLEENADQLEKRAEKMATEMGYSAIILIATDYLRQGSQLFIFGPLKKRVCQALDLQKNRFIPSIMSRKNQIIPKLVLHLSR